MRFGKKKVVEPNLYGGDAIGAMRRAGYVAAQILGELSVLAEPGVTTSELSDVALKRLKGEGVKPAFLGYEKFPAVLCASVNETAVHGVPNDTPLEDGDLLKLDFGVIEQGYYSDTARTIAIGNVSIDARRLMQVTEEALKLGIASVQPGNFTGDISSAVQKHVEKAGFEVVRELTGHGIGTQLHEPPQIPNFGEPGEGVELKPGMVIAIEPITTFSTKHVTLARDGFAYVTDNGSLSAHFEHTVAVTASGPIVLTTYET